MSAPAGAMLNEMHAKRLRAAGHTVPVPVTFLHGWGDDSTLIAGEVKKTGLFRVHDVQIQGSSLRAMYFTRYGLYGALIVLTYLYFLYHTYTVVLLFPFAWFGFKHCERKTVLSVLDKDIDTAVESLRDESPGLVVGYHYGGGLATYLLQHRWVSSEFKAAPACRAA